jgi:hypothetical protein
VLDCSAFQRRFGCSAGGRAAIRSATLEWLHKAPDFGVKSEQSKRTTR